MNVVHHAAMINGLTDLVVTKLDILSGLPEVKICTGYEIDGKVYDYIPSSVEKVAKAKPVYEVLPGWEEDISGMTRYEELPENCKTYLRRMDSGFRWFPLAPTVSTTFTSIPFWRTERGTAQTASEPICLLIPVPLFQEKRLPQRGSLFCCPGSGLVCLTGYAEN